MSIDKEVCLCFHVSLRKIVNFVRVQRPKRASQISECGGAGTGCGWCRPILERIFELQSIPANEHPARNRLGKNPGGNPGDKRFDKIAEGIVLDAAGNELLSSVEQYASNRQKYLTAKKKGEQA